MNTEPVSIEINLRQNVDTEGQKATKAMDNLAASTIRERKEVEASLKLQSEYVGKLRKELERLEAQYNNINNKKDKNAEDYEARKKITRAIIELNRELNVEARELDVLKQEYKRLKKAQDDIVSSTMRVKREMIALKRAGLEGTGEYKQLVGELESLARAQAEVNKQQRLLAKGSGSVYTAMLEGLQGLAGILTAGAGAMALLGDESEEYAKIQTRLQSLIAITMGLQQAHNLFVSTSAVRMKGAKLVTDLWTAAHTRLAIALRITTAQAKLLTAVMTGGVSLLIVGAIYALDTYLSKIREAKKAEKELRDNAAEKASQEIATLRKLSQQYQALGGNVKAQKKFIEDNKDEIEKTGFAVKTLSQADALFVSATADFEQAIRDRAKAAAAMDLAAEKYKQAIIKMLEAEKRETDVKWKDEWKAAFFHSSEGMAYNTGEHYARQVAEGMRSEAKKIEEEGDKIISLSIQDKQSAEKTANAHGVKTVEQQKQEDEARKRADKARKEAEKRAKDIADAEKKLASMTLSNQRQIDAAIVAAMREGRERKLREIELEHRQKVDAIKAQYKEIEELERKHGVNGSAQKAQLAALEQHLEEAKAKEVTDINENSDRALKRVLSESSEDFRPRLEKELADIREHYSTLLEEARKHAKDDEELERATAKIKADRRKREMLAHREHQLEQLDFEGEVARMRMELQSQDITSEAERDHLRIALELETAEKRLEKLMQIKEAGGDADKDIALAIEQIKILKRELQDIPVKRIREIGREIKGIFSSLSGLGGEIGQVFGSLSSGVDNVMAMMDNGVSTMGRISAGLKGLVELYNLGAQQAKKNEEAEKKWADAIIASARRAALARIDALKHVDSNVWGVGNPYAKAIAGAKQYREAMVELNKSVEELNNGKIQTGTRRVTSGENIAKGVASGAAAGAAIGSIIPGLGTAVGAGIGAAIGGLFGGIFGATKKKVVPIFQDLKSRFGSILKKGSETFELNPEILNNYDKLDDKTKKLVDNWSEYQKKAVEAQENIKNTLKELSGELGNILSKSIMEGFMSGDIQVGMANFEAELDKMIGRIVEQMLFAAVFEEQFKELQRTMMDSFKEGGDGTIVDDLKDFRKSYREGAKQLHNALKEADDELKKDGINAWEQERKAVARKGLAQASQDSIDEVVGLQTNMVMQLRILVELKTSQIKAYEERDIIMRSIAINVAKIAEDTSFLHRLEGIASDIAALKRDGITLKK